MVASASDKLLKVGNPGSATTLSAPGYTMGDSAITVGSTSNWSTDTGVVFAIDEAQVVDGQEVQVAGTYNEYIGVVSSGTSVTSVAWQTGVGDRNYASGALTRVYIPVSAERENRIVEWGTVEHDQDGTHKSITTDTLTASGNVTINGTLTIGGSGSSGGWSPISGTVTAVAANGNRSYDLTTSTDNTSAISPGMRLRTTRTVAAPTQSTSLNGTTQYYSKTTPSAMTFTDDFVVSAWVKLSSYAQGTIIGRADATPANGFYLEVQATGQVRMLGFNGGGGNYSTVQSYQSLPLNKWVHIAAQLDMSAFTATTTTSYIMIDGVDVPAVVARAGTNPTAIVQAGDLAAGRPGSFAGQYFPGKIAQAAIFSAKVTQATIRGYMSQGLSGSEPSLISAYSFNGVITDLSANANNLTANGGAVATNADSPFGGQAGGTISSTLDYGIVQAITSTTITVQVPEGCTIPTTGGVSAVSYANMRVPYGFPSQQGKWTISYYALATQTTTRIVNQKTSNLTWLWIPVGEWHLHVDTTMVWNSSSAAEARIYGGLSFTQDGNAEVFQGHKNNLATAGLVTAPVSVGMDFSAPTARHAFWTVWAAAGAGTLSVGWGDFMHLRAENAYL